MKKFIIISYTVLKKFKKIKISTHCCLVINQNVKLFFFITSSQKDPDPGSKSGYEILDFQFEDPDPKLLISDPEHCFTGISESGSKSNFFTKSKENILKIILSDLTQ